MYFELTFISVFTITFIIAFLFYFRQVSFCVDDSKANMTSYHPPSEPQNQRSTNYQVNKQHIEKSTRRKLEKSVSVEKHVRGHFERNETTGRHSRGHIARNYSLDGYPRDRNMPVKKSDVGYCDNGNNWPHGSLNLFLQAFWTSFFYLFLFFFLGTKL